MVKLVECMKKRSNADMLAFDFYLPLYAAPKGVYLLELFFPLVQDKS